MKLQIDEVNTAKWGALVNKMRSSSVFHRSEWLEAAGRVSGWKQHYLLGTGDGQPLLAFPVFYRSHSGLRAVVSPPPRLGIEYLGPVFDDELLQDPTLELKRLRTLEGALRWIEDHYRPALSYFRMVPEIRDVRALTWSKYQVSCLYTYRLSVSDRTDDLIASFHPSIRRGIRRPGSNVDVRNGAREICERAHEFVEARYRAQEMTFGPSRDYLLDLYDSLGPNHFQPIGAYVDGALEAAAIVTFHGTRGSFWQHAAAASSRLPLTALMIWHAIALARERGCSELEIVGANTRRLVEYKSKFRPVLAPFFEAEKATLMGKWAAAAYRRLHGGGRKRT